MKKTLEFISNELLFLFEDDWFRIVDGRKGFRESYVRLASDTLTLTVGSQGDSLLGISINPHEHDGAFFPEAAMRLWRYPHRRQWSGGGLSRE